MEAKLLFLALSFFGASFGSPKHGRDLSVCKPSPSGIGDPGPPIKIPDQFYVHTEIIAPMESLTTTLTEYFDYINKRGMIYQARDGVELKAYFDYTTNEFIRVYPQENNKCIVDMLSLDENNFLMGTTSPDGKAHMFSPAKSLHLKNRGVYQGISKTRGINTHHWKSCQYWSTTDTTVEAHWYFSVNNTWNTATGMANVPVRFHVKGSQYDNNKEKHDVETIYEFYHFRSGLPSDETIFETPNGVYCPNRKIKKKLPKLPETMSFYTEIIDRTDVIVTTINEEYDFTAKLARFAYTALPEYNIFNNNPVVDIHDFQTGVSYVINTVLGNCTVRSIPHNGLDIKDVNVHNVRMASAKNFFDFPADKYSYEGTKTIRGISAESWVGVRDNWPRKGSKQSVWEWYFAQDSTLDVTGDSGGFSAPLQLRVSLPQEQIDYDFNVYAYKTQQPDLSSYDVSACYLFHKREKFGMSLPIMYKMYVEMNVKMFKFYVITAISLTVNITPLRIQNLEITFGDDVIFITFEIVDVAPIVGDVAKPRKEVPLDTAVKSLLTKLNSNEFEIEIFNGQQITILKPKPVKLEIVKYQKARIKTQYASSSMAGLGIAMIIVGFLIGGFIAYFKCQ